MTEENTSKGENVLWNIVGHRENDLTRMFALVLNYNRNLLEKVLESFGINDVKTKINDVKIVTQERSKQKGIYDIVIFLNNEFEIIIEAKLEDITRDLDQLLLYSETLAKDKNDNKFENVKLVFLTKYDQSHVCGNLLKNYSFLTGDELIYCRWTKQYNKINSIYNTLKEADNTSLPSNFYKDFLDYLENLTISEEFLICSIENNHQWEKVTSEGKYEFKAQGVDRKIIPSKGAEYFLPYREKTKFEPDDGIDCCAEITGIESDGNLFVIEFDKLQKFKDNLKVKVTEKGLKYGYTDLITLKKALVRGIADIKYPIQKPENWMSFEIPNNEKWGWLIDCPIEKLLIV